MSSGGPDTSPAGAVATAVASDPASSRIVDLLVVLFAVWTLCCNAVVAAGGTRSTLIATFALACVLLAVGLFFGRASKSEEAQPALPPRERENGSSPLGRAVAPIGFALGLGSALLYSWHRDPVILWWSLVVVLLGAAVAAAIRPIQRPGAPATGRGLELALWGLGLVCAAIALGAHRPDWDDSFYVNLAVAVADRPQWPLLSSDTLHGIDDLPMHLPVYRVHSYELGIGAISALLGVPAIYAFHWISAAFAAFLLPLAHAKLFRVVTPKHWLAATALLAVVLVASGDAHRWYGNFSFVRMWQGKALFLYLFTPLIYLYALQFMLSTGRVRGRIRPWLLLASAQIAAMGCSSSAIWAGPLAAGAAALCATPLTRSGLRSLVLCGLSSSYVLLLGWSLKGAVANHIPHAPVATELGLHLKEAIEIVLGAGPLQIVALAAIAVAWACTAPGVGRRFAIAVPLVVCVLMSPYLSSWVAGNLTGPSYWRLLWAMPVPLLIALIGVAPLRIGERASANAEGDSRFRGEGAARWTGPAICLLALVAFVVWVPREHGLSVANGVRWEAPRLKVDRAAYDLAGVLNESVPSGSRVVAPPDVSGWVPTFHRHAFPLQVRVYLKAHRDPLGREFRLRRSMSTAVTGVPLPARALLDFREGLLELDVRGVCLRATPAAAPLRPILEERGFRMTVARWGHQIWVRD